MKIKESTIDGKDFSFYLFFEKKRIVYEIELERLVKLLVKFSLCHLYLTRHVKRSCLNTSCGGGSETSLSVTSYFYHREQRDLFHPLDFSLFF